MSINEEASLMVKYKLVLPRDFLSPLERRTKAGKTNCRVNEREEDACETNQDNRKI